MVPSPNRRCSGHAPCRPPLGTCGSGIATSCRSYLLLPCDSADGLLDSPFEGLHDPCITAEADPFSAFVDAGFEFIGEPQRNLCCHSRDDTSYLGGRCARDCCCRPIHHRRVRCRRARPARLARSDMAAHRPRMLGAARRVHLRRSRCSPAGLMQSVTEADVLPHGWRCVTCWHTKE